MPILIAFELAPFLIIPAILVVIALIIAGAILSAKQARQRQQALADLAREMGWSFDPGHNSHFDNRFPQFQVFQKGHSRSAYNSLSGSMQVGNHNLRVRAGDYLYKITTSTGKSTTTRTHRFSYLVLNLPFSTPGLLIRREAIIDKLKSAFGFDDIDFESEEFSKRFYVQSEDKRFAYDVIHPRMIEFLLSNNPPMIHVAGNSSLTCDDGKRWSPGTYRAKIRFIKQFFELWPDHLTTKLEQLHGQ